MTMGFQRDPAGFLGIHRPLQGSLLFHKEYKKKIITLPNLPPGYYSRFHRKVPQGRGYGPWIIDPKEWTQGRKGIIIKNL